MLNRYTALDKPGLSAPTERRIANLLNASIGKNHAQTTDFSKPGDDTGRDYVEAIVAGSFDMSDVEEIRISPELQDARTRVSSVKANDVRDSDVRELLANVLPEKDIDAATKLISEAQTDPKAKQAATAVRELIASRLSLVRERSSRRDIRRQVTQKSSGDRVPKVTFLNREGINIDDHRTFKRTSDALAMGEEYEIDDIVKYGSAQKVREQLSAAGISTSPQESFTAMKPKPAREPRASLRSSGATGSRDDVLREMSGQENRRRARRMDEGRPQLLGDSRSAVMARQGRENTTRLAQREALRSSGSTSILSDRSGGRSSFRTRGAGASLRSSGSTRSTDVKISEGPVNLPNGLDSQNLPKVLSSVELEQKFGDSPRKHKRHFARYGVKLKGEVPTDPVEKESYYSSLQALDDLFQNVDPKKLLKGQKIEIEVGSNVQMLSGDSDVIGEFNRSRRIFFTAGPQKGEIRIDTAELGRKGSELFQNPNRLRNALQNAGLPDFVSRLFLNQEALDSFDAQNEITRRLSYASMVHEFGHLLDYLAVKKEDKIRWRSAMGSMIFGEQDAETLRRGTMMSASIEDELNELPSVSVYGQSSPQEKMAEGFAAWWLFSKRPDIQIMGTTTERIVESLLEELGPRVKSAKQSSRKRGKDVLPPLVALYTMLPFMIEGGENK